MFCKSIGQELRCFYKDEGGREGGRERGVSVRDDKQVGPVGAEPLQADDDDVVES